MSDKDHPHESCKNCKFFHEHMIMAFPKHWDADGICKRYPHVVFFNDDGEPEARQPNVYDDEWCGEWK